MRIKIAARSSDLARIQALYVGEKLKTAHPQLEIDFFFKSSWGDNNPDAVLSEIPEKGVFTQDFAQMLDQGECDMVVHSWKDLPTEERDKTFVVATLPREAINDVLLVRKETIRQQTKNLQVLSSSPRREYCLTPFVQEALPWIPDTVEFKIVRGNVPTRLRKLFEGQGDALVVAAAALNRILTAPSEFAPVQKEIRGYLQEMQWMVVPLSQNPAAPAQGALAIEIRRDRDDLKKILAPIHHAATFANVVAEREILKSYGGGCHARLGASLKSYPFGRVEWARGEMNNELIRRQKLYPQQPRPQWKKAACWPLANAENLFAKVPLKIDHQAVEGHDLMVVRSEAWPNVTPSAQQIVWCSGWNSWKKLARKNVWVSGCCDGLGESEKPDVEALLGRPPRWLRLTHDSTLVSDSTPRLATYSVQVQEPLNLQGKTQFYWSSPQLFATALKLRPEISGPGFDHACGPGKTYEYLTTKVSSGSLHVYLSYQDWVNEVR